MMTDSPKTDVGVPKPFQDDLSLKDLACTEIHVLVSQLHQAGTREPKEK
jgi:hypothetical protein